MNTSRIRWLRTLAVIAVIAVAQVGTFDQTLVADRIRLDLPLYLLIAIGFVSRSDEAAVLGFVTGLSVDVFQFSPFGLSAMLFAVVAWGLAESQIRLLHPGRVFRTVQGAMATIGVTTLLWFSGVIFDQDPPPFTNSTLVTLLLIGLIGAVMVHPATRVARWLLDDRPASDMTTSTVLR